MGLRSGHSRSGLGAELIPFAEALHLALDEVKAPRGRLLQLEDLPLQDPWLPDVAELNLLARPFLELAGLHELDVFVELWDGKQKLRGLPDESKHRPGFAPSVWFDSLDDGLCIFGGELGAADEVDRCVADTAHAAARAFWAARRLKLPFAELPEVSADVTAVRLGFGAVMLRRPVVLGRQELLSLLALEVRAGNLDVHALQLAVAPRHHPALLELLTDA